MPDLIDLRAYPVHSTIDMLLKDKSTKRNIVWATSSYEDLGEGYEAESQITKELLFSEGYSNVIQPRILKAVDEQQNRTRDKGEVFTPAWLCCQMNNYLDEEWFGKPDVFNKMDGKTWIVNEEPVAFSDSKTWQQYVDSRRLEITCGEAPYIVSRYDTASGDLILPLKSRIGLLDRKLRIVNENTVTEEEWFKWAVRAVQSVYGYEYQGDNLLIARINLLMTFTDYLEERLGRYATSSELNKVSNIISWNLWQMDGLTGNVPKAAITSHQTQMSLFENYENNIDVPVSIPCKVFDWRRDRSLDYNEIRR